MYLFDCVSLRGTVGGNASFNVEESQKQFVMVKDFCTNNNSKDSNLSLPELLSIFFFHIYDHKIKFSSSLLP